MPAFYQPPPTTNSVYTSLFCSGQHKPFLTALILSALPCNTKQNDSDTKARFHTFILVTAHCGATEHRLTIRLLFHRKSHTTSHDDTRFHFSHCPNKPTPNTTGSFYHSSHAKEIVHDMNPWNALADLK